MIDQHVIENAAGIVRDQAIANLARLGIIDSPGQHPVEKLRRIGAVETQASHVRDIEQRGGCAGCLMLGDDRTVVHRHRPAGEVDHSATVRGVPFVKRSLGERGGHTAK